MAMARVEHVVLGTTSAIKVAAVRRALAHIRASLLVRIVKVSKEPPSLVEAATAL